MLKELASAGGFYNQMLLHFYELVISSSARPIILTIRMMIWRSARSNPT
jgi:hypothetical protein